MFSASDGLRGNELWRSEGRPATTGTLSFVADDGAHGHELWRHVP